MTQKEWEYFRKARYLVLNGDYFITFYEADRKCLLFIKTMAGRYGLRYRELEDKNYRLEFILERHYDILAKVVRFTQESDKVDRKYISQDLQDIVNFGYKGFIVQVMEDLKEEELEKQLERQRYATARKG